MTRIVVNVNKMTGDPSPPACKSVYKARPNYKQTDILFWERVAKFLQAPLSISF